ncbi:hypothetical protein [Peribacillus glennii]|nr:hypothetical protein [Peribacillus glennii]
MESIELFAWVLSSILGVCFVISLVAVFRKPRFNDKERKKSRII